MRAVYKVYKMFNITSMQTNKDNVALRLTHAPDSYTFWRFIDAYTHITMRSEDTLEPYVRRSALLWK